MHHVKYAEKEKKRRSSNPIVGLRHISVILNFVVARNFVLQAGLCQTSKFKVTIASGQQTGNRKQDDRQDRLACRRIDTVRYSKILSCIINLCKLHS